MGTKLEDFLVIGLDLIHEQEAAIGVQNAKPEMHKGRLRKTHWKTHWKTQDDSLEDSVSVESAVDIR